MLAGVCSLRYQKNLTVQTAPIMTTLVRADQSGGLLVCNTNRLTIYHCTISTNES
jgi:hypothetical protein